MAGHIGDMVSQHWNTPERLVVAVRTFFGGQIELDPCDNAFSLTKATVSLRGTNSTTDDGLKRDWGFHRNVYCNPPYGRDPERGTSIVDWIAKGYHTNKNTQHFDDPTEVIMLIPASTETEMWEDWIWGKAEICFIYRRVKFLLDGEEKAGSTKGSALIYWGHRRQEFKDAFQQFGYVTK